MATAATFALLVGLGGRELGADLAAGRYLHRMVDVGDEVDVDGVEGIVVDVHPATLELLVGDETVHVPNSRVMRGHVRMRRSR